MDRYEYIKWYWKYIDAETPILLFYEVDLKADRYATRMAEVFADRSIHQVLEPGNDYVTDGPIPEIGEINTEAEFMTKLITKEQFEKIYISDYYSDCIDFPK